MTGLAVILRRPMSWVVVGVTALTVTGGLAGSASAQSPRAAHREPFLLVQRENCSGASAGTPTDSFVVIKENGDNTFSAQVELKNVAPNTLYLVSVGETPSNCFIIDQKAIETNGQGDGSVHASGQINPGKTGVWVSATTGPLGTHRFLATPNYVFGSQ